MVGTTNISSGQYVLSAVEVIKQRTVFFNQLKKHRSELKFDVDNLKLCYKHGF